MGTVNFCHPECNEGSFRWNEQILRFAQNDKKKRQDDKRKEFGTAGVRSVRKENDPCKANFVVATLLGSATFSKEKAKN